MAAACAARGTATTITIPVRISTAANSPRVQPEFGRIRTLQLPLGFGYRVAEFCVFFRPDLVISLVRRYPSYADTRFENCRLTPRSAGSAAARSNPVDGSGTS